VGHDPLDRHVQDVGAGGLADLLLVLRHGVNDVAHGDDALAMPAVLADDDAAGALQAQAVDHARHGGRRGHGHHLVPLLGQQFLDLHPDSPRRHVLDTHPRDGASQAVGKVAHVNDDAMIQIMDGSLAG
jgi:hypothetical protein